MGSVCSVQCTCMFPLLSKSYTLLCTIYFPQGSGLVKPSREEWMMELPPEIQVHALGNDSLSACMSHEKLMLHNPLTVVESL